MSKKTELEALYRRTLADKPVPKGLNPYGNEDYKINLKLDIDKWFDKHRSFLVDGHKFQDITTLYAGINLNSKLKKLYNEHKSNGANATNRIFRVDGCKWLSVQIKVKDPRKEFRSLNLSLYRSSKLRPKSYSLRFNSDEFRQVIRRLTYMDVWSPQELIRKVGVIDHQLWVIYKHDVYILKNETLENIWDSHPSLNMCKKVQQNDFNVQYQVEIEEFDEQYPEVLVRDNLFNTL